MQEERLAELLERYHSGESNAATSRELECVFSIKGIEVRQMVNRLRRKGIPIASSGSGYFYAATEQEVRATIAHLTRRISGIAAAIAGLNRSLEQFDTAQTRLTLEGGDAVEYPDNLKSKATLWLWALRDLAIIGIGSLISVFALSQLGFFVPIVLTAAYAFLSIRMDDTSILDFLRYAVRYFLLQQQSYSWGMTKTIQNQR